MQLTANDAETNTRFDGAGRESYVFGDAPGGGRTTYAYTGGYWPHGALLYAVYGKQFYPPYTAGDTGWSRNYSYDGVGNRWLTYNSGVPPQGNTPTTSYTYNSNNQINGRGYDAAGNQTNVNGDTLTYDAENRLTAGLKKWFDALARWIRSNFAKSPVPSIEAYIGPSALQWHKEGGLLLPINRPPVNDQWRASLQPRLDLREKAS